MGLALLLASSAFAATKAELNLRNPTTVNGTKLKPGDYKLQWDGSGPNVEVSIMQGKTVVAKVPAKVVDLQALQRTTRPCEEQRRRHQRRSPARASKARSSLSNLGDSGDGMQAGSSK